MTFAPIDKDLVAIAKMRLARWLDVTEHPTKLRSKVLRGVDLIAKELPARADWFELSTVALDDSCGMNIRVKAKSFRAFQCSDCLAVSTIVPSWARGWSKILKDEEVYQILSWLLHYARQYIHRSYVASMLMIVWEDKQKVLHPFGSRMMSDYHGRMRPLVSAERAFVAAEAKAIHNWGACKTPAASIVASNSPWLQRNTLDPFLHQGVFHFLRAQNLRSNNFAMESIVALDCAKQSIVGFVRARFHLPHEPTRPDVLQRLGLPVDLSRSAQYLYFLRNNFGAHAGGWRWWDQGELLEGGALDDFADLIGVSLAAAADIEPKVRSIEPEPAQWGEWFFEHFETLWDAIWFEKADAWDSKLAIP
jgi:hypothetical protein